MNELMMAMSLIFDNFLRETGMPEKMRMKYKQELNYLILRAVARDNMELVEQALRQHEEERERFRQQNAEKLQRIFKELVKE